MIQLAEDFSNIFSWEQEDEIVSQRFPKFHRASFQSTFSQVPPEWQHTAVLHGGVFPEV